MTKETTSEKRSKEKISDLKRRIGICEKDKREITKQVSKLNAEEINDYLECKSLEEWIKGYDDVIETYKKKITEHGKDIKTVSEKKIKVPQILTIVTILILLMGGFFFLRPIITGLFVGAPVTTYVDTLNLEFTDSTEYIWTPEQYGEINSVKLSGSLIGDGTARVYIEKDNVRYLILDSSSEVEGITSITGLVVAETNVTLNESLEIINETLVNETIIIAEENITTINQTNITLSDLTNETNATLINLTLNETSITLINITPENITEVNVTINQTNVTLINITPGLINITPENITEVNVTEENKTIVITTFENVCVDTCSLADFNLSSYNLIIELDNVSLKLDSISYTVIVPKEITVNLEYKTGTQWDTNDDGVESRNGVVDLTVENSVFNWNVDESDLCTRWRVDSLDNETSTFVCYGNNVCCNVLGLEPSLNYWNDTFNSFYGRYGATQNNEISAQVVYITEEVVSSEWGKLPVSFSAEKITPKIKAFKKDYRVSEEAKFEFEFLEEKELLKLNKSLAKRKTEKKIKKWETSTEIVEIFVYDSKGRLTDIQAEIEEEREGKFSIKLPKQRQFRPGLYRLKIELTRDGITYTQEQDFTWGVLAINVNKSIYLENENAFIGIGVLDDSGSIVCNADVTLEITDPSNSKTTLTTANGDIQVSDECTFLGVTELPDYYTDYTVNGVGTYLMNLTAVTSNGVRTIQDNFSVQSSVDFDVARKGATRIYPYVPYVMSFTINANKNYNGPIIEYVPASFEITAQDGLTITTLGDAKLLTWNQQLRKGETYNLAYEFDAPDVSPEFYLLGELQIGQWQEFRQWQIASDQPERQTFFAPSGNFTNQGNWVNPNLATGSDDGVVTHVFDDCAELLCTFGFDVTNVSGTLDQVWLNITWNNSGTAEDAFIRYKIKAGGPEQFNFNVNPTPKPLTSVSYNITQALIDNNEFSVENLSNIYLCLDTDKIGGCGLPNFTVDSISLYVEWTGGDTSPPTVTLNAPVNNTNTSLTKISFNFTGTDSESALKNASLYGNFSGTWQANETNQTILTSGVSAIINSTLPEGHFIWNVLVCDDAATPNCAFATENFTLTVDRTGPSITLNPNSPSDGLNTTNTSFVFNFTAIDIDTSFGCNLTINGTINATNLAVQSGVPTNFSPSDFKDGTYTWNITCTDNLDNFGNSSTRTFTVDTIQPTTTLEYPPAAYFNDTSDPYTINFNCSATDNNGIENISLYLTNSTNASFILNQSTNVSGTSAVANWSVSLANGNYTWDCLTYDSAGNSAFSAANRTVLINFSGPTNIDPNISFVYSSSATPVDGTSKEIYILFNASDGDGFGDINVSTAKVTLNFSTTFRNSTSCTLQEGAGTTAKINCTVIIYYFDFDGLWTINVSVKDNSSVIAYNDTTLHSMDVLSAIQINPSSLSFGTSLNPGQTDIAAIDDPLQVNNTGNQDFTTIQVAGVDLAGLTNFSYVIRAANFTVNITDQIGTNLTNGTGITIGGASVNRGNNSFEQLFFFLRSIPSGFLGQVYDTTLFGTWNVSVS